jgi:hypothetical protein
VTSATKGAFTTAIRGVGNLFKKKENKKKDEENK